ncbi:MAG: type II secretion system F family protein [Nocardioidaceae bacterium]|nr:type II secretion system F family protein [Nocardioidaceae bacterium]
MSTVVRRWRSLGAGAAAACLLALSGGFLAGAHAADDATIDHSETAAGQLKLLVSVPGDADVDLGSVKVTLDGSTVDAEATVAESSDAIRRTTVLAIDTSNSMAGDRIAAAKAAALTYLDTVPDNVYIGIVTFDNDVVVRQQPSLDRAASKAIVEALSLKLNTALYRGVQTAITATGTGAGQRQVLVLSDGEDNTKAPLAPVLSAIRKSGVKVDAVALEQGAQAPPALKSMADTSKGQVISADAEALGDAFANEADALARQILVTATVPASVTATDASVQVSLDAGGSTHTASAFVNVKAAAAPPPDTSPAIAAESKAPFEVPTNVMYGAIAAIGLGAVVLLGVLLTPAKAQPVSLGDQLAVYSASADTAEAHQRKRGAVKPAGPSIADQAKQAAENVLASNASIEAKIAHRLEGAGMALKASEWLLMHAGIAFLAGLLGLLLTAGNPIGLVVFLILGAIGPWVYLSFKRSRRLKAFSEGLADTLQLMSGSMSAGLSLAQSLDTIVREGTEPITSEFKRVIVESRLGVPLEDALDGVAERMQSVDFRWVVMAIRIQREVGGNLAELLTTVAATLREREYIRRHVRALSAEGRLSCWILGGLPPAFLAYLAVSRPEYVKPMFTTVLGWGMIGLMSALLAVGIFWMSKVAKVEV